MFSGVGLVVTWQREVAGRIALRFGQAAVFAAAVLQDVSSRVHPVFCSPAAEVTSIHLALEETERLPSHRRINRKTHHHPGTGTLLRPLWLWPGVRGEEKKQDSVFRNLLQSRRGVRRSAGRRRAGLHLWGRGCWTAWCAAARPTSPTVSLRPPPGWARTGTSGCWREGQGMRSVSGRGFW